MIRIAMTTVLALTLATGSALPEERHRREVYGEGQIFQNVEARHVVPLLRNQAWVTHWENGEGMLPDGGYISIVWYGADGKEYRCLQDRTGAAGGGPEGFVYSGVIIELQRRAVRYPLLKGVYVDGAGYALLRYNGGTGELTTFIMDRRWWEADVGHLQDRIPAVTYDICPEFPSAESLGTTVNEKQTSRRYFELLRQDPGRRTLHPEYVNENAHEWLTEE